MYGFILYDQLLSYYNGLGTLLTPQNNAQVIK